MKKTTISITVVLLLSIFNLALTIIPENVNATTRFVGGAGPGNFTTIQDAVNASNQGDTIFVFNGTYFEHVTLNKTLNLVGEDRNTTVIDGGGSGSTLNITADWVNVTDITVTGGGAGWDDGGLKLYQVENCTIENIVSSPNMQVGIYVNFSHNNKIVNNTILDSMFGIILEFSEFNLILSNNLSERNAMELYFSDNNRITDNVGFNGSYGIRLFSSNENTVENNRLLSYVEMGIPVERSDNNTISNNTISMTGGLAVYLHESPDTSLINNTMVQGGIFIDGYSLEHWNTHTIDVSNTANGKPVYYLKNAVDGSIPVGAGQVILANCKNVDVMSQNISNTNAGIQLGFSSNNTIENNIASHNIEGSGIRLVLSNGNLLINNTAESNSFNGLRLTYSHNNTISDSFIALNDISGSMGIRLYTSHGNVITNDTLVSNGIYLVSSWHTLIADNDITGDGIQIQVSENNTILRNYVSGGGGGIGLWSSSNGNVVAENILRSNIEGVTLAAGSINNIITGNIVRDNGRGFFLDSLSDNLVYHNNFINNSNQALANSDLNEWDNGYPSGGNYWSDYIGTDLFSGPNQDHLGSDGIGDTPYSFTGDMDRYPLLYPFEVSVFRRPTILDATLSGNNLENVTIKWSLSPDDGGGLGSVNAYRVYRNSTYDLTGMGYQLIATLPNGTYEFVDNFTGEGDPNNYFYIVCAVNSTNVFTCAHDQAGKFTRTLSEGPNLVSIPLFQSDESFEVVLQTLSFDKSWFYDSLNQQWESYVRSKPHIGELRHVNHTMGLWVNVTASSNLTVAGMVPSSTAIELRIGWNLISFPSFQNNYTAAVLKLKTDAIRIEAYDPLLPPYYLRESNDSDFLLTGFGYWVNAQNENIWIVDNS